jgi:hypothetical protein
LLSLSHNFVPSSLFPNVSDEFVLLSAQFPYIFQPFYVGSTSVYFHLTDAQYNIMKLSVRH